MKNKILSALLIYLTLVPRPALAALSEPDKAQIPIKEILVNGGAENGKAGWVTYDDSAAAPVDGLGGTVTTTWAASTSSPLAGNAMFVLTKDAANRQGEGVCRAVTVPVAYRGQALQLSFKYSQASGTYATGDLAVFFIQDPSGTPVVQTPYPYQLGVSGSGVSTPFSTLVPTVSSTGSYAVCIHVASTSASAYAFNFDEISLSPNLSATGAIVTDWQTYTPTLSWVSNVSTNTAKWRQVGDSAEVEGLVVLNGAPTSATFTTSPPAACTIDTAKMTASSAGSTSLGIASGDDSGNVHVGVVSYGGTTTTIRVYGDDGTSTWTQAVPFTWGSGDELKIKYTVPCVGWTSGVNLGSSVRNAPTVQRLTSGTAQTYTLPAGVKYLLVKMIGGGGGGGGSGTTNGTAAGDGVDTTFGTSLLTAKGGSKGARDSNGGAGGVAGTVAAPASTIFNIVGGRGGGTGDQATSPVTGIGGGMGGGGFFGGNGGGGTTGGGGSGVGTDAATNSGGGGGGAAGARITNVTGGSGGGSGNYVQALIENPAPTYTYTVGGGGVGQLAGTSGNAGGAGGSGVIVVEEYYLNAGSVTGGNVTTPYSGTTFINATVSKSSSYTATSSDETIIFTADATLSLPAAANVPGKKYHVMSSGAGTNVTVDPNGSETACAQTTIMVNGTGDSIEIQSDGANWQGLGGSCYLIRSAGIGSTGTTSQEIAEWVSGDASVASAVYTITIDTGVFSSTPSCQVADFGETTNFNVNVTSATATQVVARTFDTANAATASAFRITCQGAR